MQWFDCGSVWPFAPAALGAIGTAIAVVVVSQIVTVLWFLWYFEIRAISDLLDILKNFLQSHNQHAVASIFRMREGDSKKHGGMLVAQVLKEHNVEHIFTLCGGHISPILVSCEQNDIRVIDVRHEVTAVFAADAVARLRQTIGVAAVTAGPGLTNTVTAIKNAQMAESPVLLLGGAAAALLKGRGALQDIDQMALFKPICKHCVTITRVKDIIPEMRKAIHIAQSGTPGPVFVEFPVDTLYPFPIVRKELGLIKNPRNPYDHMVNFVLECYFARLYGDGWKEQDATPIPPIVPYPQLHKVLEAVNLVKKSKKPLILIGSQATLPPIEPDHLRKAVEVMNIPCYLGGMARGLLGRSGKLHIRQNRKDALKEADVVILAGSVCDFRLNYGRVLSRKSAVIVVNRNKKQMLRNSDMFWTPTVAVEADVGSFLVALSDRLEAIGYSGPADTWLESLTSKDAEKEEKNRAMAEQKPETNLNPLKVLHELEETIPDDAILVADGGDFVGSAAYIVRPRGPLQWLDPGAFGTLGVGGGFALGAKACFPDRPVYILYGDGSCGYSIVEFDSYQRHKLPVIAVVGNDGCWTQIAREQKPTFGTTIGCDLVESEYEKVVMAFGGVGLRVTDENALRQTFQEALEQNRNGRSVFLNVLIGKSTFREGSLSV